MQPNWRTRAFTQIEAAQLIGLSPGHLKVWVHRNRHVDVLFSEKRKGRRYFSPMDISVLRIAHEIERGGMNMLFAIGAAFEILQEIPAVSSVLKIKNGATGVRKSNVIDDADVPRVIVDHSLQLIPIGKLVQEVLKRCAELIKEPAQ